MIGRDLGEMFYRPLREPAAPRLRPPSVGACRRACFSTCGVWRRSKGWARAQLGMLGEGVALIRKGLAGWPTEKRGSLDTHLLAEAQAARRHVSTTPWTRSKWPRRQNPEEMSTGPNAPSAAANCGTNSVIPNWLKPIFARRSRSRKRWSAKFWELRATT